LSEFSIRHSVNSSGSIKKIGIDEEHMHLSFQISVQQISEINLIIFKICINKMFHRYFEVP